MQQTAPNAAFPDPSPDMARPRCLVLACDVLADGGLRVWAYDAVCGHAFRAALRRAPDGAWFVEDRPRFVGIGGPFRRDEAEARAETALRAWAEAREGEADAVRAAAAREAQARPRPVDEARMRKARNARRQADVQDRAGQTLEAQLRERVGRGLDGFPLAFEMTHRGVRYAVTVSEDDPLLRIEGGTEPPVAIGWDGASAGRAGPVLPPPGARSLAHQAARRRPDLLSAMTPLLKARWTAMGHRADAERLEGAQSPSSLPDKAGTLAPDALEGRFGWHSVTPLTGRRLQVVLHDLREARQVHALVEPADGAWATHGLMSALSFRTGRREDLADPGLTDPDLAAEALRIGLDYARQANLADLDADAGAWPSGGDPVPDATGEEAPPRDPVPGPAAPDEPTHPTPEPETAADAPTEGDAPDSVADCAPDDVPAPAEDADAGHRAAPGAAQLPVDFPATSGSPEPWRPSAVPSVASRDPDPTPDDALAPADDARQPMGGEGGVPAAGPAPAPDVEERDVGGPPVQESPVQESPAQESLAETRAGPSEPPARAAAPRGPHREPDAAPPPRVPAPVRPAAVPPPAAQAGPGPADAFPDAPDDWHDEEEDDHFDPEADPGSSIEPEIDAYLLDPGDLPPDDIAALDLLMARPRTAPAPVEDAKVTRLREIIGMGERLRASGRPYPNFPLRQSLHTNGTQREMMLYVSAEPVEIRVTGAPHVHEGRRFVPSCSFGLTGRPKPADGDLERLERISTAYQTWGKTFRNEAQEIVRETVIETPIGTALRAEAARAALAELVPGGRR